jgi:hypothetical protein
MQCCACGKPINEGEYRYRETMTAFIVQHRACCKADPNWRRMEADAERRAAAEDESEYHIAVLRELSATLEHRSPERHRAIEWALSIAAAPEVPRG